MSAKERLLNALFPAERGAELINLKFLPYDPGISAEELCREFLDAREEYRSEQTLEMAEIGPYLKAEKN